MRSALLALPNHITMSGCGLALVVIPAGNWKRQEKSLCRDSLSCSLLIAMSTSDWGFHLCPARMSFLTSSFAAYRSSITQVCSPFCSLRLKQQSPPLIITGTPLCVILDPNTDECDLKSIKECHYLHRLTLFSSMKDERSFMDVVVIWDVCRNGHKNNRIIKEGVISPERDDMCHCAFELSSSELKSHLLGLAAVLDLFFFHLDLIIQKTLKHFIYI